MDRESEETLHLDMADVERAREAGGNGDILDLIMDNAHAAMADIIKAAHVNETPVTLDGETITREQIATAIDSEAKPGL